MINNVETLMNVPDIVTRGADWFRELGTEKSPGTKMFTISGKVERPGQLRGPDGHAVPRAARGARRRRPGRQALKAFTPGGSSTPLLTADAIDVHLDYESIAEAGSLLGTGAIMVMDETDCVVDGRRAHGAVLRPRVVRQVHAVPRGSWWATRVLGRLEDGYGREERHPAHARHGHEHPVPRVLRARRRHRLGHQLQPQALRRRVRGARPARPLPAPRAGARAAEEVAS